MFCPGYDLQIVQGTDFSINFFLSGNNNPLNLSGCSLESYIRLRYGNTGFYNLNPNIINITGGEISLNINNLTTSGIPVGIFFYDLNVINSSGQITKPLKGLVYVSPQITY